MHHNARDHALILFGEIMCYYLLVVLVSGILQYDKQFPSHGVCSDVCKCRERYVNFTMRGCFYRKRTAH